MDQPCDCRKELAGFGEINPVYLNLTNRPRVTTLVYRFRRGLLCCVVVVLCLFEYRLLDHLSVLDNGRRPDQCFFGAVITCIAAETTFDRLGDGT